MKKDALNSGAELAPISLTLGMWSGMGVVSTTTSVLNLREEVNLGRLDCHMEGNRVPCFSVRHGCECGITTTGPIETAMTFCELRTRTEDDGGCFASQAAELQVAKKSRELA